MANRMCKSLLQSAEDVLVGGKRTSVDRMRKASKVGRSRSRLAKAYTQTGIRFVLIINWRRGKDALDGGL